MSFSINIGSTCNQGLSPISADSEAVVLENWLRWSRAFYSRNYLLLIYLFTNNCKTTNPCPAFAIPARACTLATSAPQVPVGTELFSFSLLQAEQSGHGHRASSEKSRISSAVGNPMYLNHYFSFFPRGNAGNLRLFRLLGFVQPGLPVVVVDTRPAEFQQRMQHFVLSHGSEIYQG